MNQPAYLAGLFYAQGHRMRYPNTRYGNPTELRYYTQGLSVKQIAKQLKRSEKSINAWPNGNRKIPFWVPELLRLRHMERDLTMRQMRFGEQKLKFGLVSGNIIEFKPHRPKANDKDNRYLDEHCPDADELRTRKNL